MAEARNQVAQNTGVVDLEDEDELTVVNGETTVPGMYPRTSAGMPEGAPPAAPRIASHDDLRRVEASLGRPSGSENHPDGPGVGGD